jgi:hypothetical protein
LEANGKTSLLHQKPPSQGIVPFKPFLGDIMDGSAVAVAGFKCKSNLIMSSLAN